MKKKIAQIILAIVLFGYLVFSFFFFSDKKEEAICRGLEIIIIDSTKKPFVKEADISYLLKRAKINPVGKPIQTINTEHIEEILTKSERIAFADAYKTPSGLIGIKIKQTIPILRIMTSSGSYYIDEQGKTMSSSTYFTSRVPLASGNISKEFASKELLRFALFLQNDDYWNEHIVQLYVHSNKEIELVPLIGSHRILLGSLEDFENKLAHLKLFYEQAIPKFGWEKYKLINLKYKNQVVCEKYDP